jgi:hypothetical protein
LKKNSISIFILSFLLLLACGKNAEHPAETSPDFGSLKKESPASSVRGQVGLDQSMDEVANSPSDAESYVREEKAQNVLGKVFAPVNTTNDRLLEYNIQLSYECADLVKTRKDLLDFIAKYGYLESSSAVNSQSPYMTARIHVASVKLYEALLELDKLGNLLSEDISAIDHTEGMVWQKRKSTREKIRQVRRNIANSQITAGAKNWQLVEESIANSEDQLDLAEHETWKINDKVKWATISVSYATPTPADVVQVPAYKNAFIGLFNMFLELTYYLIWILPFVFILGILAYYGKIAYRKIISK